VELKKVVYVDHVPTSGRIVLAGDIGGTNSNFGICQLKDNKIILLVSYHAKSKKIADFAGLVSQVVDSVKTDYAIVLSEACFGAAGVVADDRERIKPTNLDIVIDLKKVRQQAHLQRAVLINDFDAVTYGIAYLPADSLVTVNKGMDQKHAAKAIIGAGTGLGKSIMGYVPQLKSYTPLPSEGGHADFPPQTDKELALAAFVKKEIGRCNVSWEDVLSGNGIGRIFKFLGTIKIYDDTDIAKSIIDNGYHPDQIFAHWQQDKRCHDTYVWYSRFYGRSAKNFALETLSLAGFYIAGGIAAKNLPLFQLPGFMDEFINCGKQEALLKQVPVTVIADYNVSLYGAAAYLAKQ